MPTYKRRLNRYFIFKVTKMSSITNAVTRYNSLKFLNFLGKNGTNFRRRQNLLFHTSLRVNVKGQEIKMPSLSPTMTQGKIVKWLKKEGDTISPGDVLCDVETDKAVMSMETEEEGILAKILVPENSTNVNVGSLIALMVESGENWQEVELPSEVSSVSPNETTVPGESVKSEPTLGTPGIEVKMPSLSPTMTAGTILKWYKKEGDAITAGDVLCDIQTDKAVISFETEEEGILAKILIPEDTKDVKVGTLIALIVGENEDWRNVVAPQTVSSEKVSEKPESTVSSSSSDHKHLEDKSGKLYGPAVRSLLSVYQLDASSVKSTGRNNILLKEDVLKYIEDHKLQKKPPKPVSLPQVISRTSQSVSLPSDVSVPEKTFSGPTQSNDSFLQQQSSTRKYRENYVDIELSNIRRVIAKRLTESKQGIPHAYGRVTCEVDELVRLRKDLIDRGMKASLNDYIIKAAAFALEACPRINVISINDEYKHSASIDIAVAVATPSGLITPIITDVGHKSVKEISDTIREMVPRAREGRLKPHEFQGGSFTISNLGMFGIKHFTAIINPPQVAILAVGALIDRFGSDRRTHHDLSFTLSYDRRALEEDEVAEFLQKLKFLMENPRQLVAENVSAARAYGL